MKKHQHVWNAINVHRAGDLISGIYFCGRCGREAVRSYLPRRGGRIEKVPTVRIRAKDYHKVEIELPGFHCLRCGHEWVPVKKGRKPKICPKCKSPYWNIPRGQKRGPKKGAKYKPRREKGKMVKR